VTLKYFGKEGMQAILGGILETRYYLCDLLGVHPDMVGVNADDSGLVTLFRVYPKGIDAKAQYAMELNEPARRTDLLRHNRLTEAIGKQLFEWYRTGKRIEGRYTPHLSFTTGFRNANYNRDGSDPEAVVYALKSFPMNVFVTPESMRWALHCVHAARDEVVSSGHLAEERRT
jgi:hypothetical protein